MKVNFLSDFLPEIMGEIKAQVGGDLLFDNKKFEMTLPEEIGQGDISGASFVNGLDFVFLKNLFLKEPVELINSLEAEDNTFEITMVLKEATNWHFITPKLSEEFSKGAFLLTPKVKEFIKMPVGKNFSFFSLFLRPDFYQNYLLSEEEHVAPLKAKQIFNSQSRSFLKLKSLNHSLSLILRKIENTPYQGSLKNIFLESQLMELVTIFLQDIDIIEKKTKKLNRKDIESIYDAREILKKNLYNPPSVKKLAHLVYMNEYKLRVGFRELFNTTVYEYLRKLRMHEAKLLLETSEFNISEAGHQVGYTNLSHFTEAFRDEFGINPSEFKKSLYNFNSGA